MFGTFGFMQTEAAPAGITFLGSVTQSAVSTSLNIDVTSLGLQENDIVIGILGVEVGANIGFNITGYTQLFDLYANDSRDTNFATFYKVQTSTPDTSLNCSQNQGASRAFAAIIYAFRGVDTSTIFDVTTTTSTGVNDGRPQLPTISPTTPGTWIVAVGGATTGSVNNNFGILYNGDGGYENTIAEGVLNGSYGIQIGANTKERTFGVADPGDMLGGQSFTSLSRCAATLALRPA